MFIATAGITAFARKGGGGGGADVRSTDPSVTYPSISTSYFLYSFPYLLTYQKFFLVQEIHRVPSHSVVVFLFSV